MVYADTLRFTSALAVALAFVFLLTAAGIAVVKLANGSIGMPRLLPDLSDMHSVWKLFTVVPVLVMSYVCHFNGTQVNYIGDEYIYTSY